MISQIGPLVQGGSETRVLSALHIAGGLAGGAASGIVLGSISSVAAEVWSDGLRLAREFAFPTVLLFLALMDLGLIPAIFTRPRRQTPASWVCSLGARGAVTAWGFDLGLGLTTLFPSQLMLALPAFCLVSGNVPLAILVMGGYGAIRAVATSATVLFAHGAYADACTLYYRWGMQVKSGLAGIGVALAICLIAVTVASILILG